MCCRRSPVEGLFTLGDFWPCMAVVVRCNERHRGTATAADAPWEGCSCVITFAGDPPFTRVTCAMASTRDSAAILADFEVSQVLKVTSIGSDAALRKTWVSFHPEKTVREVRASQSLVIHFREDSASNLSVTDPAVVHTAKCYV